MSYSFANLALVAMVLLLSACGERSSESNTSRAMRLSAVIIGDGDGGYIPPSPTIPTGGDGGTIVPTPTSTPTADNDPITAGCGLAPCPPTLAPTPTMTSAPSAEAVIPTPTQTDAVTIAPTATHTSTIAPTPTGTSIGDGGTIAPTPTTTGGDSGTIEPTPTQTDTVTIAPTPTQTDVVTIAPTPTHTNTIAPTPTQTDVVTIAPTPTSTSNASCPGGSEEIAQTVLLLDDTATKALEIAGNGVLAVSGSLVVNSRDHQAAVASGNAVVQANRFEIVGQYSTNGNAKFQVDSASQLAAPLADPLRFLPAPGLAAMVVRSAGTLSLSQGNHTLQPGRYLGGIRIDGKASVTLAPGVYSLEGGALQMAGQSSLQGEGVMIYAKADSGSALKFSGQAVVKLKPPSQGSYRGITYFQARGANASLDLTGQQSWDVQGMIYAPAADAKLAGNGVLKMGGQYLVRTMKITGNGRFQVTPGNLVPVGCP